MAAFTIKHSDEFEAIEGSGGCTWHLARKALGTGAFGFNLVEIAPGGQLPEHSEGGSGQVEVYAILAGEATMVLDGEEHPAPAGTWASIEPSATRTIVNHSAAPVTALLIGVDPSGSYEPLSWA
jgi:quercetin dioxygenase-like cupin family protein